MSFTIAIVGRPNVGKSTLFNRLVGKRVALVDDQPGVTRDRREGTGRLGDIDFTVIDTAGFEEASIESLAGRMRAQTETAMAQADAILFLIDARAGLTPTDRAFAAAVRKTGRPVVLVANKSEGRASEAGVYEAFGLGLGEPVGVSAEHGLGLSDLYDALREALPDLTEEAAAATRAEVLAEREAKAAARDGFTTDTAEPAAAPAPRPVRIAVVGRPNAGKSTLINRLLGDERLLTGPEAGITRDSIAVELDWHGRAFQVHDTAGMRRKSKIDDKLEKMSVSDALEAIRFAEVVVLLIDATAPFEEQDLRIADLVEREGRALVIGLSKWDLAEGETGALTRLRQEAEHRLPQLAGMPVVAVSGLTGAGLDRLMQAVLDIHAIWNRRVPTNALNRWLDSAIDGHPPPAVSGRRLKLNYITQPKARPPSFVLFCSRADAVPESYKRYLINGLRESFDLPGTPIRLTLREKANPYATRAKGR
ncbi:ribosome biogenesis GTPase Der [Rhodoplanes elegans]|uniref:GTPase Der n=1 Tax=Rhodoplanes elegans TaxID=29408 RepID=A0A327JYJ7_9BRAD|nr:ribosome biogenesis GTPase Der [Rhodoplanes elegans]MBK5961665.1 ribosome biogenesis GTPase Der [Rhodoplanes elegans]RAI30585.1 ribosome biogenesis GTPase Der [Rhodoplanes elegans]